MTPFKIAYNSDNTQITMSFDGSDCTARILPATTASNPKCSCTDKTGDVVFTYSVSSSGTTTLTPASGSPAKFTPWNPACWRQAIPNPICENPVPMKYGTIPLGSHVCCASDSDAKKCASASSSNVACAGCTIGREQICYYGITGDSLVVTKKYACPSDSKCSNNVVKYPGDPLISVNTC